jgi:branched-chain amino acid aminotransferase
MYASQTGLGLNSDEFAFYMIASPCEAYFSGALKVLIEREFKRACAGGSGMAKMAGNYGPMFLVANKAKAHDCGLSLLLDADQGRYVEEFSVMNFFAVRNGELHTPRLGGTILAGVTRASVITLARNSGLTVVETDIAIDDLLEEIRQGICTEIFATGTATTLTGVSHLVDAGASASEAGQSDTIFTVPQGPVAAQLKQQLQDIYHGKVQPPHSDWLTPIVFKDNEP